MQAEYSLIESVIYALYKRYKEYEVPFLTAIIVGLIAHGFSFANKLVQQDDLSAFYGKGTSLSAGRWMLEVIDSVFPNVSMPWIYGGLSLLMLATAVCIICAWIEIKNRTLQAVASGLFISISSITGLFTQPYLAAANSAAILLAVVSTVCFTAKEGSKKKLVVGIISLMISLGIYQAYISLASSLLIIYMLQDLLFHNKKASVVLTEGFKYVLFLFLSIIAYGAVTVALQKIFHVEMLSYAVSRSGILMRIAVAYSAFFNFFFKGYFSLVNSEWSILFHALILLIAAFLFVLQIRKISVQSTILAIVCVLLLPLSVNAMHLVSSVDVLGPLAAMGFFAIYLFVIFLLENSWKDGLPEKVMRVSRDLSILALCGIILSNSYFSNKVYLKMYMQTQQMTSFYTSVMTQVMSLPEYDGTQPLAFVSTPSEITYSIDEIDTANFIGLCSEDVFGIYTRNNFIKLYLGYDIPFASEDEQYMIEHAEIVDDMPSYPAEGSIQVIGPFAIVKLG